MGRIVFHVGYPKCGSSSLQGNLFGVHSSIDYLSTNVQSETLTDFQADSRPAEFFRALTSTDECAVDRVRSIWAEHYVPAINKDRITVLSEENLLDIGSPPAEVLARIASVAPEAHILIVIRDQAEVLRSYYDMYPTIGEGRSARYAPFSIWLEHALAGEVRLVERLKYSKAISAALHNFNSSQVHVLNFDKLYKTWDEIQHLADVLEIDMGDVREALSKPALNDHQIHAGKKLTRRIMGPFHASDILPYTTIRRLNRVIGIIMPTKKTQLSTRERRRIIDFYADDNARLTELAPEIGWYS